MLFFTFAGSVNGKTLPIPSLEKHLQPDYHNRESLVSKSDSIDQAQSSSHSALSSKGSVAKNKLAQSLPPIQIQQPIQQMNSQKTVNLHWKGQDRLKEPSNIIAAENISEKTKSSQSSIQCCNSLSKSQLLQMKETPSRLSSIPIECTKENRNGKTGELESTANTGKSKQVAANKTKSVTTAAVNQTVHCMLSSLSQEHAAQEMVVEEQATALSQLLQDTSLNQKGVQTSVTLDAPVSKSGAKHSGSNENIQENDSESQFLSQLEGQSQNVMMLLFQRVLYFVPFFSRLNWLKVDQYLLLNWRNPYLWKFSLNIAYWNPNINVSHVQFW